MATALEEEEKEEEEEEEEEPVSEASRQQEVSSHSLSKRNKKTCTKRYNPNAVSQESFNHCFVPGKHCLIRRQTKKTCGR